jgi:hypothetical protein
MANDIQIIVDSSDLQKAVDWMDKMGQSGKKLGTRTKTLQQEFDKYNRKLKQNQAELKRIKMATDPVYAADQKLKNMKRLLRSEIEQGNMSLREAGAEMLRYRKSVNSMTTAVQLSGKAARRKEVAFQQAGYQVQDFIVQVQAGTNPLIAFSQQGSQLAGFFAGPWGAAIGVGIAAVSTLTMVVLSLNQALNGLQEELKTVSDDLELSLSGASSKAVLEANKEIAKKMGEIYDIENKKLDLTYADAVVRETIGDYQSAYASKQKETVDKLKEELAELVRKRNQLEIVNGLVGSEALEAANIASNREYEARQRKIAADEAKKLADEQEKINNKAKDQLGLIEQQVTLSAIEKEYGKDSLEYQGQKNRFILYNLQASLRQQKVEESIIDELLEATTAHQENLASIKEQTAEAARLKKQFDEAFKTRTLEYKLRFSGEATVMGQSVTASGKKMKPKQSYEELIALGMSPEQIENLFGMKAPKGKRGLKQQIDDTRELSEVQKQQVAIADSVSSSFGDMFMTMVDGTTSAKDAFRSMASDIIRQLYRILVLEQMVQSIAGAITGAFNPASAAGTEGTVAPPRRPTGIFGIFDGGGYTGSGPRSGGLDGKGGFMAMLHPRETVVDHTKGQSTGGDVVTVNQTINVTTGVQQTVRAEIKQLMPQIADSAKAAVLDAKRRGGSYGRAFA